MGLFAYKSFGSDLDGCVGDRADSLIDGSGGISGMAGIAGKLSFECIIAAVGGFELAAAGAVEVAEGDVELAGCGQGGAPLSAASDVPLVLVSGGTPSGDWLKAFVPARVA